jgi:hypothetical protein
MSSDDGRRVLDRFVAGLPVGADELAEAITAVALERSVVVQAIVRGLTDASPLVRLRMARRVGEMAEVDAVIVAQLRVAVVQDDDVRVRETCAAAMRAHAVAVPGEPPPGEPRGERGTRARAGLALRLMLAGQTRGDEARVRIVPRWRDDAEGLSGRCYLAGPGAPRIELESLPTAWVGSLPGLRADRPDAGPAVLGTAASPVGADGRVSIPLQPPAGSSNEDLLLWLQSDLELFAPAR